jgi:polyisoprenoid-binding protein YceI
MRKIQIKAVVILSLFSAVISSQAGTYDFKDPKGVNNATFTLDAPLEAIRGSASGVSGTVSFDPEKPESTTGKIVVSSSSIRVGNPMMQQHLEGAKWLEVSKYPEITFEVGEMKNTKKDGINITADVVGTFSLKGVTKSITLPVKFTYLKDKLGQRVPNTQGDLLVIRANFSIKRSDFGIQPGQMEEKVAEQIDLALSIAGACPK